jgi:tRNA-Thr(GGU) m(6)t(6)A37 methyltransferase TsaA
MDATIRPIAHIRSDFGSKFGIPRQSGLIDGLTAEIVFEPPYRDQNALRGLEGFSHIWLIWQFSENLAQGWSPTVRPPRLGGNERLGVFATRSPFRPNALGLSCVELLAVEAEGPEGPVLRVAGADLMDGTPIFDIKPYVPYTDARPEAKSGFAPPPETEVLRVDCASELLSPLPAEKRPALLAVLALDPRPRYQHTDGRAYGLAFAGFNVRFSVTGETLTVLSIEKLKS